MSGKTGIFVCVFFAVLALVGIGAKVVREAEVDKRHGQSGESIQTQSSTANKEEAELGGAPESLVSQEYAERFLREGEEQKPLPPRHFLRQLERDLREGEEQKPLSPLALPEPQQSPKSQGIDAGYFRARRDCKYVKVQRIAYPRIYRTITVRRKCPFVAPQITRENDWQLRQTDTPQGKFELLLGNERERHEAHKLDDEEYQRIEQMTPEEAFEELRSYVSE